jgi:Domain of Unknown Function (DUF1080)
MGGRRFVSTLVVVSSVALLAVSAATAQRSGRLSTWRLWWGAATITNTGATLSSKVPTSAAETHSALLTGSRAWSDQTISLKTTTLDQLREGSTPNTWEVGWVMFHFRDLANYYYFILKPNGYELGKKQGSDAQIFLDTGDLPTLVVGKSHALKIVVRGARIRVWVDGTRAVDFTDPSPLPAGSVGLYEEDSRVSFEAVSLTQ